MTCGYRLGKCPHMKIIETPLYQFVKRHRAELQKELAGLKVQREGIDHAIGEIERLLGGSIIGNGRSTSGNATTKASGKAGGKRRGKKRTGDEMKAFAQGIANFIAAAGDKGRSGTDVRAKFEIPNGTTIKGLVAKYTDTKLRTSGTQRSMMYFAK